MTHGLSAARAVVLPTEQEEFDLFAEALQSAWSPEGAQERLHWERLLHSAWRLKRITRMETSVLGLYQKEQGPDPDD